ncbi:MAG: methionyl-tRNA formyltransferase [Eubacterium sp.]|nr:methionyl-tRNA formyltransferase [Eubacterium sp.]
MKIVYMGTPDFAVPPLKSIYEAGHEVVGVFTQPDRPKGRSNKLVPSDVKVAATELGIEVFQPEKLREAESVETLKRLAPDLIVVAAYGQILSEEVLNLPRYGCINIHASLLPKYRGASPIEASILSGDEETGVTIMYMAKDLDTGDIIAQSTALIGRHNTETLTKELSILGAELVVKTISDLESGKATRTPQDDSLSTYSGKLDKSMGRLDFSKTAAELERTVRAMYPWPCAYTALDGKTLKIIDTEVVDLSEEILSDTSVKEGCVAEVTKKYFIIRCKDKGLKIKKLQPEGKKPMDTVAFLNGYKINIGQPIG